MAKIVKLPKHSRATRQNAEMARQAIRDIPMPDEARAVLDNALYLITDTPGARAVFTMINNEQFRYVMRATKSLARPDLTWKVFSAAVTYARQDTGEILATRGQLADDAGTDADEVSRAMGELSKIGAILKERRGRNVVYKVNPHVAWNGGEGARLAAARTAPRLNLINGGKLDPVSDYIVDKAIEYLRGCDWQTRDKWAKRAVALGADQITAMISKENLAEWTRWVALEMVHDGLISADL
jgi:hypothetical protein